MKIRLGWTALMVFGVASVALAQPAWFDLTLRSRSQDANPETSAKLLRIHFQQQRWSANETAVIICDMWDAHHCLNAVRRVQQLAPRIDAFVDQWREAGSTVIHAPSSCMDFYKDHPARHLAQSVPRATQLPEQIESWCHWKNDHEETIGYPIDHSDGGEDDDLEEHARWHEQLAAIGRNPKAPWIRQIDVIQIKDGDYLTDDGVVTWSILEQRGIHNVILVGVHTNMCVLGRPFGLRQMSRNGKNVVLVRDLTDTMYNPAMPPFVNHFSGTDLIIEHVEQNVCPTISSDQVLGGEPLRFRGDRRPHVVMLIGEREYDTQASLPAFARHHLYRDYRVSYVLADEENKNYFHDIQQLENADLLLVSVRRRTPPLDQLDRIRRHIELGKPVLGIRTASHAFALRGDEAPPAGHGVWPDFDAEVFGGNYQGHHGNKKDSGIKTFVWPTTDESSPLLDGVGLDGEHYVASWLYKTSPLAPGTRCLMMGRVAERLPHEPVTWTHIHRGGGRAFYTSLGHTQDFADPAFQTLLANAVDWCLHFE